jgi:hypothetical protein
MRRSALRRVRSSRERIASRPILRARRCSAGVCSEHWLTAAAAQIPQLKLSTARTIIAGIALAIGGLLLVIATHWGHFG